MLAEAISRDLAIGLDAVQLLARTASHRYKRYFVKKRNGLYREIFHPARELKALQRWVASRVLPRLPVHACATAYRTGASIRANALAHADSNFLLRMDFAAFFPSLKQLDVIEHFRRHLGTMPRGWGDSDSALLAQLCCRNGALTIGAPTSPALSNSLCYDLDSHLAALSARHGVAFTRYADDLFFSSKVPGVLVAVQGEVQRTVAALGHPAALSLNSAKTLHTSRKRRRTVTGVVITSDRALSLGRSQKRYVRSLVYRHAVLTDDQRKHLAGLLGHCKSVEPGFINKLIIRYGPEVMDAVRRGATGSTAASSTNDGTSAA